MHAQTKDTHLHSTLSLRSTFLGGCCSCAARTSCRFPTGVGWIAALDALETCWGHGSQWESHSEYVKVAHGFQSSKRHQISCILRHPCLNLPTHLRSTVVDSCWLALSSLAYDSICICMIEELAGGNPNWLGCWVTLQRYDFLTNEFGRSQIVQAAKHTPSSPFLCTAMCLGDEVPLQEGTHVCCMPCSSQNRNPQFVADRGTHSWASIATRKLR